MAQHLRTASVLAAGLVGLLSCLAVAGADALTGGPKRVLILESFGRDFAPWNTFTPAFKTELARQLQAPIEFHEAALGVSRADDLQAEETLAQHLRTLYAGREPDLVVPVGAVSAQFWWRHRNHVFPTSPVVVGGIGDRMFRRLDLGTNDTVVAFEFDADAIMEVILQTLPGTTNIALVLGDSPIERLWVEEAEQAWEPFTNRVHLEWYNKLPFTEMCRRAAAMPPGSALLYRMLNVDAAGVPHERMKALDELCARSSAPVFGMFEEQLGHGIIGGRLISNDALGRETVRIAARVLGGERPGNIPPLVIGVSQPTYDWRELRRWRVDERRLPPGSLVRFREASVWERYRWYILGALALMLAQAATIMGLVLQRARRRQAETAAYELAGRLIGVQENERRVIAGNLHDGLGQDLLVIASQAQLSLSQPDNPPATVQRLKEIAETARQAVQQARRMAHNLRPGLLEELGLTKAIRATANKTGQAAGFSLEITLSDVDGLLRSEFEVNLFRIAQETLNNILKHAGASQVKITLSWERAYLRLVVEDDGRGFDPSHLASLAPGQRGLGLQQITERAKMMSGRATIQSRPGQGTRLTVEVPTSRRNNGR